MGGKFGDMMTLETETFMTVAGELDVARTYTELCIRDMTGIMYMLKAMLGVRLITASMAFI